MAALRRKGWLIVAGGALAAGGVAIVAWIRRQEKMPAPAFPYIRDAGPEAQRDGDAENWDAVDEASDESFPASDAPALH